MSCCGCEAANAVAKRTSAQLRVLWLVLVINVGVFIGEFGAGWWASSTALQSDSLDSLGDFRGAESGPPAIRAPFANALARKELNWRPVTYQAR